MIIFQGIKKRNGGTFLLFGNEKGSSAEVPVDERTARHIELHLERLSPPKEVEEEAAKTSA
jgi:hypothetical protein